MLELVAGAEQDRWGLESFASEFGLSRPRDQWHRLSWERASKFVRQHRLALALIEAALMEHEQLDGEQIERLTHAGPVAGSCVAG